MFQFCSLSSGSSGNCLLFRTDRAKLLIDCGISCKNAVSLLDTVGVDISTIDAVLVTHEHIDHVKGIGVLARKYKIPVFANIPTWQAMPQSVGLVPPAEKKVIDGADFQIGDITVHTFFTSHDAACSLGYSLCAAGKKAVTATDTGYIPRTLLADFANVDFAYIEANHDVAMLAHGNYPYPLKQRILSDRGHLPNTAAADLAAFLAGNGTKNIMLGHLSAENNTPEIAYETVLSGLTVAGLEKDVTLSVAPRYTPSGFIDI